MSNILGQSIKKFRLQKNLSVRKLAGLMFISPATVSRWETGARYPSIDALCKISKILEVEPSMLLGENDEASPERQMNIMFVTEDQLILDDIMNKAKTIIPSTSMYGFVNLEDAISYASLRHVQIAFIDIRTSGEKGIKLAKVLLSIDGMTNIIFLADSTSYMQDACQLHASGDILDPFDFTKLRQELLYLRFPVKELKL